jgi:hypothetical protein
VFTQLVAAYVAAAQNWWQATGYTKVGINNFRSL